jgi:hypothetical protein
MTDDNLNIFKQSTFGVMIDSLAFIKLSETLSELLEKGDNKQK